MKRNSPVTLDDLALLESMEAIYYDERGRPQLTAKGQEFLRVRNPQGDMTQAIHAVLAQITKGDP